MRALVLCRAGGGWLVDKEGGKDRVMKDSASNASGGFSLPIHSTAASTSMAAKVWRGFSGSRSYFDGAQHERRVAFAGR